MTGDDLPVAYKVSIRSEELLLYFKQTNTYMPVTWKRTHKNAGPKKAARRKGALARLVDNLATYPTTYPSKVARVEAEIKILIGRLGIVS